MNSKRDTEQGQTYRDISILTFYKMYRTYLYNAAGLIVFHIIFSLRRLISVIVLKDDKTAQTGLAWWTRSPCLMILSAKARLI